MSLNTVWERARELAKDKLSPIIVTALRNFICECEALAKGYERIVLKFEDSLDNELPKVKAFYGKWIIDPKAPYQVNYENRDLAEFYSVAETAKGNIVVFTYRESPDYKGCYRMLIYPSFHAAAADVDVNLAIRVALKRRGVPIEELDI